MSHIDPGVDGQIEQSANEVGSDSAVDDLDTEEEDDSLQPSRWWFASTACPLLAGTFGPMASGLNVCALSYYWRQTVPRGGFEAWGQTIRDPPWLVAVNALSLFSALIGNASLLLNMARRVRFSIAQPITITGFLLAGVLLIADLAALTAVPSYRISQPQYQPASRHALTSAFYFGIWAAAIYIIIGLLMGVTVYGAMKGHYDKQFQLTPSQRTLMLQTMSFMAYLLLGALVFSTIEDWEYLDAVYWADTTLLTIGLGDFTPGTKLGQGLLFPFAICGVLIVGLVVGSIRSLILERGKEKLAARIVEKGRRSAVHNVDERKQTIKIAMFAEADFSTDPNLSPAQRRQEEFNVMRKVQNIAERDRRWYALITSSTFALILWLVGAAIFMQTEYLQEWTYFNSLYFSFTVLMTIGYGDFAPKSNSGRAFFVLWTLLAVPSLTILISNMGDTVVKWFSDLTMWLGSIFVLPEERGLRARVRNLARNTGKWLRNASNKVRLPGKSGMTPPKHKERKDRTVYENQMLDRLAQRLNTHLGSGELDEIRNYESKDGELQRDINFYHYVLARECRKLQKDFSASPPKKYHWSEWEYYLKLMGNQEDPEDFPGQKNPDIMVPEVMRAPGGLMSNGSTGNDNSRGDMDRGASLDGNVERRTSVDQSLESRRKQHKLSRNPDSESDYLRNWSWLSNASPLMSSKSEAEWISERLSAALERELNRMRKGYQRQPPISLRDAMRAPSKATANPQEAGSSGEVAQTDEERDLEKAAGGETDSRK